MEVFQRRVCEIDTDPFYLEAVPTAIHLIYILSWKVFQNSLSEIKKFIHFLLKYLQVLYVVHIVLVSNQKLVHFLLKRLQPLNVVCKLKNNFYNICGLKKKHLTHESAGNSAVLFPPGNLQVMPARSC